MRYALFSFFLIAITTVQGFTQYFERSGYSGVGIPFFEAEIFRTFDENLKENAVIISAMLLYDDLTFVKSDTSGYDADFEWIIAVYNEKERAVFTRTVNKKLNVANYDVTNSRTENVSIKEDFSLPPGNYTILLRTIDLVTNKTAQRKVNMLFPDFTDNKLSMSTIMFLHEMERDSTGLVTNFEPTFSNNFPLRRGEFYIYFDLYSADTGIPVTVRYLLESEKKKDQIDTVITSFIEEPITSHVLNLKKKRFKHNSYELKIEVETGDNSVDKNTAFSFFWSQVPTTVADIDLALRQMTYILNPDSLDKYEDAPLEEKQVFFKRFWKDRDPDPTTAKNELMDEYFKRVNYANRQFSSFNLQGWLADRGRILIKFGAPDDIERHPFEINTRPYEIWRYYSLRKTFLFEDYSGFGDYRLHPAYLNVEYE